MKRQIINIDENKCTGCGNCIPGCPEGALQLIDGKARLISDLFCDGLGACIGECPEGAITIEKREAEPYDERKVMENIIPQGDNTIRAHLHHLKSHGEMGYYQTALTVLTQKGIPVPAAPAPEKSPLGNHRQHGQYKHANGCPGAAEIDNRDVRHPSTSSEPASTKSELKQWPIQLHLINPHAPYFQGADLLVSSDCAPFAHANFHHRFLKGKMMVTFCPKLDNAAEIYIEKLAALFEYNDIHSVSVVRMEVPCCGGTTYLVQKALEKAGKIIPIKEFTLSLSGEII